MTAKNSKMHRQTHWKQNYKAWLNELKNLRTKKTLNKTPVSKTPVSKTPVSKARNSFSNFYDDGMTANRNYLSEEDLKWII